MRTSRLTQIAQYVRIARPDHWVKHVFIVPGVMLGLLLDQGATFSILTLVIGFFSSCFIASGNYVINEYCDAEFDRYHPTKKDRPVASGSVNNIIVLVEYATLIIIGLMLGLMISIKFFVITFLFFLMGIVYNVNPFRFKELIYLDVITESFNNPIRMMLGWSMVAYSTIPPMSILISYWFGGAFLMSCKRIAEYRYISGLGQIENLKKYRKSFKLYSENSLISSSCLYALISSFFAGAFLIKYRNEFLFIFPLFAILFTYYLSLSLKAAPIVQSPEKLHKDRLLVGIVVITVVLLLFLSSVEIPFSKRVIGINQEDLNYNILE